MIIACSTVERCSTSEEEKKKKKERENFYSMDIKMRYSVCNNYLNHNCKLELVLFLLHFSVNY